MAALTRDHKVLIVTELACFATPTEIQTTLRERFKVEASLQQIQYYDPGTAQGARELAAEWKDLFQQTRETFIQNEASIACTHRAYRLRRIQRMLDDPRHSKNAKLVMSLLELAAKETGGSLTNRRELTGKDGGPIETKGTLDLTQLSDEELDALERLVSKADPDAAGDPS